jgi:hypothetical protein
MGRQRQALAINDFICFLISALGSAQGSFI